jgi:hypothetical protein
VSLGIVSDVFEVMTQVDRRLTKVNSVERIIRSINPAGNLGRHIHQAIKYTKKDKNDVLLIDLFYLHYHHPCCHSNGVWTHKRNTRINYFLVLVSKTKVERRIPA